MEQYTQVFLKEDDQIIHPGKSCQFEFDFHPKTHKKHRLFFTGEVDDFYFWKTESASTAVYKRIDESLVPGTIGHWGLKFVGAGYPVLCCRKQNWPPTLGSVGMPPHTEIWTYGISARASGVRILEGGYLRIRMEIRNKREGVLIKQTKFPPDRVITLDIPEGTYDLTEFSDTIILTDEEIANLLLYVEGDHFEGEIIFEKPFLINSGGYNIMPPFRPDSAQYASYYNWFGVNFSKREWPAMRVSLNGQVVFDGEFFERCHRYSEKEFALPEGVLQSGTNRLEFTLTSDWNNATPYRLHEVGIVS